MTMQVEEPSADRVNDKLTDIQLDIRELTTNFKNFNSSINDIKLATNEAVKLSIENKQACVTLSGKVALNTKEIEEIKSDQKDRDKEQKADRKWLIGTIIATVALLANNAKDYF